MKMRIFTFAIMLVALCVIACSTSESTNSKTIIREPHVPSQIVIGANVYSGEMEISQVGPFSYQLVASIKDDNGLCVGNSLVINTITLRNGDVDFVDVAHDVVLPSAQGFLKSSATGNFGDLGVSGTSYDVIIDFSCIIDWSSGVECQMQISPGKVIVPSSG